MDDVDFIKKVVGEYRFAKEKGLDSIVLVIETSDGFHKISEYEGGFITDKLNGVYSELEVIAEELFYYIDLGEEEIEEIRVE